MQNYKRTNSGYVFNEKGDVVAWYNPKLKDAADYEEQIAELRAEIEALKQKKEKDELMNAQSAPPSIDLQVNTKQVERAAADVKKEIDRALKSLF